jgi:hypothetical protein
MWIATHRVGSGQEIRLPALESLSHLRNLLLADPVELDSVPATEHETPLGDDLEPDMG